VEINNPHDKFFKEIFSKRKNVRDFIEKFLPEEIVSRLKLSSLKPDNNSYIDEKLKEYFTDLVYDCPYNENHEIIIAILFEHKSKIEKYPHLQLMQYYLNIWQSNIKQQKNLTPVIPIIVYHGKRGWKVRKLSQYFNGIDETLKRFMPEFDYLLIDLTKIAEKELIEKNLNSISLLISLYLMKNIFNEEELNRNLEKFIKSGEEYFDSEEGAKFIETFMLYLLNTTKVEKEELVKVIKKVSKRGGEIAMTTGEKIRQEGRQEGLKEGLKEGLLEGRQEGLQIGIKNMYSQGITQEEIMRLLKVDKNFVRKAIKNSSSHKIRINKKIGL
jgi:predicted transposase/invertase (TIGR01784 family)